MNLVGNMMFGMMAGIYTGYADMMTTGSSSYVYYMKSGKTGKTDMIDRGLAVLYMKSGIMSRHKTTGRQYLSWRIVEDPQMNK